jgi:hypothetical protein
MVALKITEVEATLAPFIAGSGTLYGGKYSNCRKLFWFYDGN